MNTELTLLARGLYATPTAPLPFMNGVDLCSFVLNTTDGPVIIYNNPGIDQTAEYIRSLGTPQRLLVNHYHEGMHGTPKLDVPVFVHERDRAQTARAMRVDGTFDVRQRLGDDLEVIPSLAHTPGAAFYLWDSGEHRYLFPGDSFWVEDGIWKAVILGESNRHAFLDTLAMMRDVDFDALAPWPAQHGKLAIDIVTEDEKQQQIDALVRRIRAGSTGPSA